MSLLTIDQLSAGYGKLVVLHEVSLAVEPGQFLAILGPNGSGKSTLVKSVFGLTDIFAGSAKMNGVELLSHPRGPLPTENCPFTTKGPASTAGMARRKPIQRASAWSLLFMFSSYAVQGKNQSIGPVLRERNKRPDQRWG